MKDNCEAVIENAEEEGTGLEDTKAKCAFLIPVNVFTSSHIIFLNNFREQLTFI